MKMFKHSWIFAAATLLFAVVSINGIAGESYVFEITPEFENAFIFTNGLAPVKQNGRWGLIDHSGKFTVPPQYDAITTTTGRYWAVSQGDKWGVISPNGAQVLSLSYDAVTPPSPTTAGTEVAAVRKGNNWNYVIMDGEKIKVMNIRQNGAKPTSVGVFRENRAAVRIDNNWGLLSIDGRVRKVSGATTLFAVSEGLSVARFGRKRGFVDSEGDLVIRPQYDNARRFSEGYAGVYDGSGWGFVDREGNLAIPCIFSAVREFDSGIAPAQDAETKKWGYIFPRGHWAISPRFDKAYGFENGIAVVNQGGRRGFIDFEGHYLVAPAFEDVWRFKEGLAPVKIAGKWGFIRLREKAEIAGEQKNMSFSDAPIPPASDDQDKSHVRVVPQLGQRGGGASAFTPDGTKVLIGDGHGTIKLWDLETGRELRELERQANGVNDVAVSPDGQRAVTATGWEEFYDGRLTLWDLGSGAVISQVGKQPSIFHSAALSPDGTRFLGYDGDFTIGDATSGRTLRRWQQRSGFSVSAFTKDGQGILAASYGKVQFYDANSAELINSAKRNTVTPRTIVLSEDNRSFLIGNDDGSIEYWDMSPMRQKNSYQHGSASVKAIAFSPGGKTGYSAHSDGSIVAWDLNTGAVVQSFSVFKDGSVWNTSFTFSPDKKFVLAGKVDEPYRLIDLGTGETKQQLRRTFRYSGATAFLPDGRRALVATEGGLIVLDLKAGTPEARIPLSRDWKVMALQLHPDGRTLWLGLQSDECKLAVWEIDAKEVRCELQDDSIYSIDNISFSQADQVVNLSASTSRLIIFWDGIKGKVLGKLKVTGDYEFPLPVALSDDGRWGLTIADNYEALSLYDLRGKTISRTLNTGVSGERPLLGVLSKDGRYAAAAIENTGIIVIWDARSGKRLQHIQAHVKGVESIQFIGDGNQLFSTGDGGSKWWDVNSGRLVKNLPGVVLRDGNSFSLAGDLALDSGIDTCLWDMVSGSELICFYALEEGEWLTITPEGFFTGSKHGDQYVNVHAGTEVYSVQQFFDQLYRPDLVLEKLAGDPAGLVSKAAQKVDLKSLATGGVPPKITILKPVHNFVSSTQTIDVEAQLADSGGGIGKVEWRVNGVSISVMGRGLARHDSGAVPGSKHDVILHQSVQLEPGRNIIEVTAYDGSNSISSKPQNLVVSWDNDNVSDPPRLFLLAAGINDYWDSRLRLSYAAADAAKVAETVKVSAHPIYQEVEAITLVDDEVTDARLDQVFADIAQRIRIQDVFVFFLAGHGKTIEGRYYFIPQDFRFDRESSVVDKGISQERWQEWFARIPARKSLLLYDTCESGSLTGNQQSMRGLDWVATQVAAVERIARATGRTVISAATDDTPALEGYKGHGLFSYVLLDAFGAGDVNGTGQIELTELIDYIDRKVPEVSYAAFNYRQIPQTHMQGSNFAIGIPVDAFMAGQSAKVPKAPTHVAIAIAKVRKEAFEDAEVVKEIPAGLLLRVIDSVDGWSLVAHDGNQLGYVPVGALVQIRK